MKIVVWVLVGIGALVLLGAVVVPFVHWVLGALGWVIAAALVVGGGVWVAKALGSKNEADKLPSGQ